MEEDERYLDSSRTMADANVISVKIIECEIWRVLVDTNNSTDVLFLNVFNELGLDRSRLKSCPKSLISFTGYSAKVEGTISISMITWEKNEPQTIVMTKFLVMNRSSVYDDLL